MFVHHILHVNDTDISSKAIDFTRAALVVTTHVTSVEADAETLLSYTSDWSPDILHQLEA